ncbi:MAG: hypothetical protein PHI06_14935, partial [Desulfobulbaceae bacterium]|nr:hypothetical protein [Desulfobulbaceae bacterium]
TADTWDRLCKKYRIPFAYAFYLHDYISYSRTFPDHDVSFVTIGQPTKHTFEPFDPDHEGYYQRRGEPYAKLLISGDGHKSDVLKYIENNWDKIEDILKEQGWTRPKKIRKTINKDRNRLVKQLWLCSTKELQKLADLNDTKYKDRLIQKVLKKRGISLSEGYIRKLRYWR